MNAHEQTPRPPSRAHECAQACTCGTHEHTHTHTRMHKQAQQLVFELQEQRRLGLVTYRGPLHEERSDVLYEERSESSLPMSEGSFDGDASCPPAHEERRRSCSCSSDGDHDGDDGDDGVT